MPAITIQTNVADGNISDEFLKEISAMVARLLSKPEKFVAVQLCAGQRIFFGGSNDPAALIDLASIGLESNQTAELSKQIMTLFEDKLSISPSRIYIRFSDFSGAMIGWNKGTF